MMVIIFSWEYPPRVVGQLANYVKRLSGELVKNQTKIYVVTYHDYLTGEYDEPEGVRTIRVTNPVRTHIGVLTWVLTLNQEVERATANIYYDTHGQVDVIDVHDYHFIPAAVTIKKGLGIPFVYSVDSLEEHRSHAANSPFNMAIKSIEWLGMYEATELLVKSDWMQNEVIRQYRVPSSKIRVVQPDSKEWLNDILQTYEKAAGGKTAQ
jgi:glycogen(starch) synthase